MRGPGFSAVASLLSFISARAQIVSVFGKSGSTVVIIMYIIVDYTKAFKLGMLLMNIWYAGEDGCCKTFDQS